MTALLSGVTHKNEQARNLKVTTEAGRTLKNQSGKKDICQLLGLQLGGGRNDVNFNSTIN